MKTPHPAAADAYPPRECPVCGAEPGEDPYYQLEPGPAARSLQKVALALLPIMAALYLWALVWGPWALGFGTGHGYFALFLIGFPSLLVYLVSRFSRGCGS